MTGTLDTYERIARVLDLNERVRNKVVLGEPHMSKYGELYPTVSQGYPGDHAMALKWLIHFADGENDLLAISDRSGLPVELLAEVVDGVVKAGLFERLGSADAV
jgi:aminopeptidase-like protein